MRLSPCPGRAQGHGARTWPKSLEDRQGAPAAQGRGAPFWGCESEELARVSSDTPAGC